MIIGVTGFGCSGSSALLDYFRQFDEISMFDKFEFQLLHQPDGICDLKYYLTNSRDRIACNAAIQRFITSQRYGKFANRMRNILKAEYDVWWQKYVEEVTQIHWKGETSINDPLDISQYSKNPFAYRLQRAIDLSLKKINKYWHFPVYKDRYFSIMSEDAFDSITSKYLYDLLSKLEIDANGLSVIDMLFSSTNPSQGMEFFDDAICFNVIRDPRDVYVQARTHPDFNRFMPNIEVEKYCIYYKSLIENVRSSENTIIIQYEDLIYKYEKITTVLKDKLGLSKFPTKEFMYFDPTFSVRYTYMKDRYSLCSKDIEYIASELAEYLYDFNSQVNPKEDECLRNMILKSENTYIGWVEE